MRHDAINNLYPTVYNQVDDKCYDVEGNPVTVDEDKVATEIARLQAEYDALAWKRLKQAEYPSIGDQMDMIYKDMKNGTSTHADAVEVVKTKYPKG